MADSPVFVLALLAVGGWATVLAAQSGAFPTHGPGAAQSGAVRAAPSPGGAPGETQRTVIPRDADGLFYVDAMVDGARVHFLIDTGSNIVVLSPQDAARAGIAQDGASGPLETVAGSTTSAMTRIHRITVAGRELHDVAATIPSVGLGVSLLGQNVLTELGEMRIDRSTLTVG